MVETKTIKISNPQIKNHRQKHQLQNLYVVTDPTTRETYWADPAEVEVKSGWDILEKSPTETFKEIELEYCQDEDGQNFITKVLNYQFVK